MVVRRFFFRSNIHLRKPLSLTNFDYILGYGFVLVYTQDILNSGNMSGNKLVLVQHREISKLGYVWYCLCLEV